MFHVRLVPSGILAALSFTCFKWRGASLVSQMVKNPPAMRETLVQSLGEGNGNPLQYSSLESAMDRGACRATVHGVTKSLT